MDLVLVSRFALPILSIFIFIFICKFTEAPRRIIRKSLMICWVAGLLAAVSYVAGMKFGFWHYTLNYLVFGLPLDRFFSGSIAYGAGFGLIYWRLRKDQSKYLFLFIILVPVYGVLSDIIGTNLTGTTFWSVDKSGWIVADLIAWTISWLIMIFIYQRIFKIENAK